ncbi:hypothetical protein QAD02_006853 [Eretmocerus hayati]|uniref:Uncharacterized protein n=1 Tax=Eretmocerus hayati TaxID=131215 RepID=A0ACC2N2V2_9HYME|nr:hypothetical protein QAD02_006853 [Eretmocerus hayati]
MSIFTRFFFWQLRVASFFATLWLFLVLLFPLFVLTLIRKLILNRHDADSEDKSEITVGIFHPYCNAGAGGERVLWAAIRALQSNYENVHIYIYTGDLDYDRETILNNVEKVFGMKMQDNINIVYLHRRKWIESQQYPVCTLLAQSIGSIYLGWEAYTLFKPDIFIDTMGYPFTYPIFKYIGGCKVASYTHYPIISTDMLDRVAQRTSAHNNRQAIVKSVVLTNMKLGYYYCLAFLYSLAGRTADIVMVNSSWTRKHIDSIWKCPQRTHLLYPPCDVEKLLQLPILKDEYKNDDIRIVSVSQFRPEKDHALMLKIFNNVRSVVDDETWKKMHLVLIGSCRDKGDESYVDRLKQFTEKLDITNNVEFKVNIPYPQLISELQRGTIGLHTMWNEHFGISVVDGLASGLIMIANKSGGPKDDIIDTRSETRNGFLATDVNEYTQMITSVLNMTLEERGKIQHSARKSVDRFSSKTFERELVRILEPFFKVKQK